MNEAISVEQARAVLAGVRSPAADEATYRATRLRHGWLFGRLRGQGQIPMGCASWVVSDNGQARRLALGEGADDALTGLMHHPDVVDDTAVQVEVTDESDQTVYVFTGPDRAYVDELIARWSDGGEPTWTRREDSGHATFGLDDVRDTTS